MENSTFTQSNYSSNYSAYQLSLPLNIYTIIDENDEVVSFLKATKGVNFNKYVVRKSSRGRKGYDNVMLLKIIIFARMIGISDLRSLESLCKHDIRFIFLANDQRPSFMAFNRLINNYLVKCIDDIYFEITKNICSIMKVDTSIQYIDGTKFEADANKYTFVYKKRINNARIKLFHSITASIVELNIDYGFNFPYHYFYCAQEIGYIVQYLMEIMVNNNIDIVYGRGKRKSNIQKRYDQFLDYFIKLDEYEYWLDIIGKDRNSCSKTDHDATMCATKMDYYCNTGLSRPCYNAQIAVSNGIIVNADLFQRPADAKTFIPFMERYYNYTREYPKYPVTDAGYGSYENYMYCITHQMELYMKYTMYAKKNEAKFKKNKFNTMNWDKNDKGNKICPNGHIFDQYIKDIKDDSGEYLRIKQLYKSEDNCKNCQYIGECCKSKKQEKILSRDVVLNEFYETVDSNLSTEKGKELKKQRSIQVEGAFGVIKQDMKFTRFSRRGLKNVKMEFLIVCLGYNLKKYHKYRLKNEKEREEKIFN